MSNLQQDVEANVEAPETAAPAPARYCRDTEHRILGGVAAGLAGATGVHVVVIRIAFVVAGLLHGVGVLAYVAAWIAMPSLDDVAAGRTRRWPAAQAALAAGLGALAFVVLVIPFAQDVVSSGVVLAVALIGVAVALWQPTPRVRFTLPSRSATDPLPALSAPDPPAARPAATAASPRGRSLVGRLTLGAALLALGAALVLDRAGATTLTAGRAASLVLVVIGAGLLVGAIAGGGRAFLALAVVALVPVALVLSTADRMGLDPFASVGGRWYGPGAADVQPLYRHGSGTVTVDLSRATAQGTTRTVTVQNAVGDVVVLVPANAAVVVEGQTAMGEVMLLDHPGQWGLDRRDAASMSPPNAKGQLRLHLTAGVGSVLVYSVLEGPA